MKILFTEVTEEWQKDWLMSHLTGHEVRFTEDGSDAAIVEAGSEVEILSVFIGSKIDASILDRLPQLKFLTTRSTGFDHIDLEAARSRSVQVSNVPFYGENTVAEHTLALLLALARNLRPSFEKIEKCDFTSEGLRGWDLKGKRLGIIGGGHIGLHVARMAKGFEMQVVVYDLHPRPDQAATIGFEYRDLPGILKIADVISLHLPLNEHTRHILDKDEFNAMKDGVYILNTARGELINTDALIEALKSGKVAGAGLDVLEEEGAIGEEVELLLGHKKAKELCVILENHVLMKMDNVIITPHNAFNSQEAIERILQTSVENIRGFVDGKPVNVVSNYKV